jgi:TPR repeat protein
MSMDAVSGQADALRQAAEAGDAEAMWRYAVRLLGLTVAAPGPGESLFPQLHAVAQALKGGGYQDARDWVQRSADAGNTLAMVVEAILLERTDRQRAERLAEQAATRGDTAAMLYLGGLLAADGDRAAARDWYAIVADLGNDAGMALLGELLLDEDPQAARSWLRRAAAAGNLRARDDLARLPGQDSAQPLDAAQPPALAPARSGAALAARRAAYVLYLVLIVTLGIGGIFVPALGKAFVAVYWVVIAVALIAAVVTGVRRRRARSAPLWRRGLDQH